MTCSPGRQMRFWLLLPLSPSLVCWRCVGRSLSESLRLHFTRCPRIRRIILALDIPGLPLSLLVLSLATPLLVFAVHGRNGIENVLRLEARRADASAVVEGGRGSRGCRYALWIGDVWRRSH